MQKVLGRSPWASNYNRVYSLPCWKGMATCIYTIKHNGGGVKKSGAYPLNRGEVTDWQLAPSLATNPSCKTNSSDTSLDLSANSSSHASEKSSSSLSIQFSPCQEELYQKRYEEGYDLPDPDYKKWLDINHPCNDDSASSKITHASGFKHADAESSLTS